MAKKKDCSAVEELFQLLTARMIQCEVKNGFIYYLSGEDYFEAQEIIKNLQKTQSDQAYNKYGANKVRMKLRFENRVSNLGAGWEYLTFDSEDEAEYYFLLAELKKAGTVEYFEVHPRLELFSGFIEIGTNQKQGPIIMTPDFLVVYRDGNKEFIDVKGMSNEAGDLRRRLYNYLAAKCPSKEFFGIPLRWVSYSKMHGDKTGWIDYNRLQQVRAKIRKEKKTV